MHKKVQSLLITGVLSANMFGSTVAVFADDDIKKENDIKTETTVNPNGEKDIEWQETNGDNYRKLWDCDEKQGSDVIILKKYIGAEQKNIGNKEKNVEIPRQINGRRVVLENLNNAMFPNVENIKVKQGEKDKKPIELKTSSLVDAFNYNTSLKSLDLRGIDVSKVKDLTGFLVGASKLEKVNLSEWNVSNVTSLDSFISGASKLEKADLSGWDVSKVTDMRNLFYGLKSLTKLDISDWNPSERLINTYSMFNGCSKLTNIDLSGFDMDNVTNAESMFQGCSELTEIKGTEKWTLKKVTNIGLMFKDTKLNFIDLSKVNLPDKLETNNMQGIFSNPNENVKNLLIVTDDQRLINYEYNKDGRTNFNLKFDANGGKFNNELETKIETIDRFTITHKELELLRKPIRDKYTFDSWGKPDSNNVLHAKWNAVVQEEKPSTPGTGQGTSKPEGEKPSNPGTGQGTGKPEEENPSKPGTGQESGKPEGENPSNPGSGQESGKPEGENPNKPGTGQGTGKPEEENPNKPGGGTNNDNTTVEPPVLDGTDKDNIMIHPLECLPSVYTLVDENMVSITQRGDGTENNPVILQVKDSIYKVDLTHFITKFDTLNSSVSTITRNDKYTEYNITVDNKNATSSIKKTAPVINDKITFVKLRINNTKIDLIKEANRYSRRRNYEVKIPIIVKFSDVKDNFWGRSCIEDFASMGVVDGYPNNEFKPNNSITRAEFVRIINNAFGYTKVANNVKFNDVEKNSWYYNDIAIGLEKGYINGRSETTFSPNDNITREEVAMILTNIMKNKDNDFNRLNNFNDGNKTSDWAKSAMAGAIKAGYLIGDDQKNLSPTKNMTRAEAIASLSRVRPVK